MKKKIIIITIIALIIAIISITFFRYNTDILYYKDVGGEEGYRQIITIYDNGVIKKEGMRNGEKIKTEIKRISNQDLNTLKVTIEKVENCKLNKVNSIIDGIYVEEYINLNIKTTLRTSKKRTYYDNEEVKELNEIIYDIEEKYLREE